MSNQFFSHQPFSPLENSLFVGLIGLFLLPIWLFKYLPLQDGPIHVHTANVLHGFLTSTPSIFQDYYITNLQLAPNWTTQIILTGLMFITSPIIAEKLLLSLYVLLLPVAVRYALNGVRANAFAPAFLAFLSFPFCYNLMFHMGFYNFAYSLVIFLFVIGYWLRHRRHFRLAQMGILLLLILGLYFTHLFSFIVFGIVVGVLNLFQGIHILLTPRRDTLILLKQLVVKTTLPTLVALLPAGVICLQFLGQTSVGSRGPRWTASMFDNLRLGSILTLSSLVSYNWLELVFAIAIISLLLALASYQLLQKFPHFHLNDRDGLLVVTIVLVGVYLLAPKTLSGSVTIKDRLLLYPVLTGMLWLAAGNYPGFVRQGMKWLLVAISSAMLILQTHTYAYFNDYLTEYISTAPLIEQNATLLAINFPTPKDALSRTADEPALWRPPTFVRPWQINLFINASGYTAVERQAVLINNYQANEDYFPVNFRPELNPFEILAADDWELGRQTSVDILGYSDITGRPIDYVSIWRTSDLPLQEEGAQAIFQQLFSAYDLIYTSPQRGYAQLYRRKGFQISAP
ncbi:hypothetical protein IXB50_01505 [Leptothoe spongobia TAU-MAC 1115]|uniref:Uncharacterized protein n=2 Tax=Leptothoe TaxID=2651725 RepID=A0A947GGB8_9CYAN|nr:hypothetical protein [Leptothoe spongobia TAU-MAC 1115]